MVALANFCFGPDGGDVNDIDESIQGFIGLLIRLLLKSAV